VGARGPEPRSGRLFRGLPIVVCGGLPAVHWPDHVLARGDKVMLHQLVVHEQRGGQLLARTERVIWRDGNRWNWDAANLEVVRRDAPLAASQRAAQRAAKPPTRPHKKRPAGT